MSWSIKLISTYLWTSRGKITGGKIEDEITGVIPDADGSTVKTLVFKGVVESVGIAVTSVVAKGEEDSVVNAMDGVVAEGADLKVGITGGVKGTAEVDVFRGTGRQSTNSEND